MRKNLFLTLLVSFCLGCKSTSITNNKLNGKKERMLKGDWTITSVTFPGSEYLNVTSFNLLDSQCFVGSDWNFISNNNKGTMRIKGNNKCQSFNSPITWYINTDRNFVFKIINGNKAKQVKSGYIMSVKNISETSFQLSNKVDVAGSIKDITYTFQRK